MPIDKQQLQHAQSLHQHGQLAEALQLYLQLHQQDPLDLTVIQLICLLYVQMERLKEAQAFIKKSLKRLPEEASLYNSLGNILSRRGKITDAIVAYRMALQLNPHYPGALNNMGNAYYHQQQLRQAQECYQQALQIDSDYPDAHFNLARLHMEQKHQAAALPHLQQVLKIAPNHAGALGQLGKIFLTQGDYPQAISYLTRRLELQPQHAESYQALAGAYLQQQEFERAIACLEKAIELDPQLDEVFYTLGTTYFIQGKVDQALKYYLQQLEQKKHLASLYNVGVILADKQRLDDATVYFQQALLLDAQHLSSHLNLAALYLKKNQLDKALSHYQTALTLDPANSEIQHILHALTQDITPERAPESFVRHLFDQYAAGYDQHLQQQLKYQVPRDLHQLVVETINPPDHSLRIVDLGCGTGLCGELFVPQAKELIGVDLSAQMLQLAKHKNIYQQLKQESIENALDSLHDCDLVIAADVFPYLGDLKIIFAKVYAALRHSGWFAFSVEKSLQHPYVLHKSIRYAHHKNYIETLCREYRFEICGEINTILREQQQKAVEGYLFILKKT